jgi:hypothetical protein
MIKSGDSYQDNTSDDAIKKAIDMTMDLLKNNPTKFKAVYSDGSVVEFNSYEEAMSYYSKDGKCKVFVI